MLHLSTLVCQIAVILIVCRVVGGLFRLIHQPRVVGEMFAGILLGPSLLGWLAPGWSGLLFPPSSLGYLSALSQVGMIIFMFLVGLRTSPKELKSQGHVAILTSHVSIVAPFVLSALLARMGSGEIFLDVPAINRDAIALAESLGLAPVFETARMYTGAIPPLRLERVFGVTTFELG